MKNNPLVLTLDFGTQSVRTALINKSGEIVYRIFCSKNWLRRAIRGFLLG